MCVFKERAPIFIEFAMSLSVRGVGWADTLIDAIASIAALMKAGVKPDLPASPSAGETWSQLSDSHADHSTHCSKSSSHR